MRARRPGAAASAEHLAPRAAANHPIQMSSGGRGDRRVGSVPDIDPPAAAPDPQALLRSRSYIQILILAALAGLPISAAAYGFLVLVDHLQKWLFEDLPESLDY